MDSVDSDDQPLSALLPPDAGATSDHSKKIEGQEWPCGHMRRGEGKQQDGGESEAAQEAAEPNLVGSHGEPLSAVLECDAGALVIFYSCIII